MCVVAARNSVRCPPSETREAEPPLRSPSLALRTCSPTPPSTRVKGVAWGADCPASRVHTAGTVGRGWVKRQRSSLAYSRPGTAWWCDCECGHLAVIPTIDILNDLDSHLARLALLVREQLDPATFEVFMTGRAQRQRLDQHPLAVAVVAALDTQPAGREAIEIGMPVHPQSADRYVPTSSCELDPQ
jgi:hypothetical protein